MEMEQNESSVIESESYPEEWRAHIEAWPEAYRAHLLQVLEANAERGDFTPELYQELRLTIEAVQEDEKMAYKGFEDRNKGAEADTRTRRIRFFPELERFDAQMIGHVVRHELGHFLSEHCIDPTQYFSYVSHRPNWANSRYIRQISQAEEGMTVGQIIHEANPDQFLHEMLADDLADYLASKTPEEMVALRLERAGSREAMAEFAQTHPDDFAYLEIEAKDLFEFFQESLTRPAEERVEQSPELAQEWRHLDGVEGESDEELLVQAIPADIGERLWSPSAPRPAKKPERGFFEWLFSSN